MGFRFHKSFKICKGVRLNVSKSGASVSLGGKGLTFNLSNRGTFVNASLRGTGLSYRQKLNLFNKKDDNKSSSSIKQSSVNKASNEDVEAYQQYVDQQEYILNLHKYANNVVNKKVFVDKINSMSDNASKDNLQKIVDGDSELIETMLDNFNSSIELPYEVNVNYQLDGSTLFVDLDLPEIEDLPNQYPTLTNTNQLIIKNKAQTTLKQEYATTIESLAIYLAASYFNISSFIDLIVISGFTQKRNTIGDEVDEYLYSIKFDRDTFESTDLQKLNKPLDFIGRFVNRINVSTNFSFKPIIPYAMSGNEETSNTFPLLMQAATELKQLGYSDEQISNVIVELKNVKLDTSDKYLKEALRLLLRSKTLDSISL